MKPKCKCQFVYLLAIFMSLTQLSSVQAQEPAVNESEARTTELGGPVIEGQEDPTADTPELSSGFFDAGSDGVYRIFPQDALVLVRGWLDEGYTYNSENPSSNFNGPYNAIDRDIAQLNQAYLILERSLTSSNRFGVGFRGDFLYGYDFFLPQSKGFEQNADGSPPIGITTETKHLFPAPCILLSEDLSQLTNMRKNHPDHHCWYFIVF